MGIVLTMVGVSVSVRIRTLIQIRYKRGGAERE